MLRDGLVIRVEEEEGRERDNRFAVVKICTWQTGSLII